MCPLLDEFELQILYAVVVEVVRNLSRTIDDIGKFIDR